MKGTAKNHEMHVGNKSNYGQNCIFLIQNRKKVISKNKAQRKGKYAKIHKTVFGFVLLKLMTCAVPRLVLIYRAQMQISLEMTKLSLRCFFHCFIF